MCRGEAGDDTVSGCKRTENNSLSRQARSDEPVYSRLLQIMQGWSEVGFWRSEWVSGSFIGAC